MSAPAAIRRRYATQVKHALDAANADLLWREWVRKHIDLIAAINLPVHVVSSQNDMSCLISSGCWSDPHPHAELVPLLEERSSRESIEQTLQLIAAFKEIQPESIGALEDYARKLLSRASK
jgi:hypothetical protein